MHPQIRARIVKRPEALGDQINPIKGCQSFPAELVHNWTSQLNLTRDQQRKITAPASMSWYLKCVIRNALSLLKYRPSITEKGGFPSVQKTVRPSTAASCLTRTTDMARQWKKADCFTLLKRITRLKHVNSEIRSEDRSSYLARYSPKGSCHLDKSSMSHTLAQNCHCEFCCEMHLTCKNTNNQMTRWIYIHIYNISQETMTI